ncbi:uncharacterized protein LOC116423906 [Nomia melanderi]|uniref:uncharacterized protein LOC116423906 n=1 Tax=Nomia melanderi TaxID=2448451 RepID=UPI00130412FD|nr:uncharacterized protein LOC116423906 [Nomia melanderi]
MYDCFNMAYQDKRNALQLNIKVNSENLLPYPQKYAGSLRVPADPSWPKIPQRKLVDDISDTIEPPCIITLSGSSRRSGTAVQTPLNQSPKSAETKGSTYSCFNHQSTHTLKRLPGYVDPRFKKVTNVKRSQDLTGEKRNQGDAFNSVELSHNKEAKEVMLQKDINRHQIKVPDKKQCHDARKINEPNVKVEPSSARPKKPDDSKSVHINEESVLKERNCACGTESKNTSHISEKIDKNEMTGKDKCMKSKNCSKHQSKTSMNDANTQVDVTSLPVQESNGQLFFMLDKQLQSHPLNTIHLDTITLPQEYLKQCYNVQVPILTYQNIPMPIPAVGTNSAMQQCSTNSECKNQIEIPSLLNQEEQKVHVSDKKSLTQVNQTVLEQTQNTNELHGNGNNYFQNCTSKTFNCFQYYFVLDAENNVIETKSVCNSKTKGALTTQDTVPCENKENLTKPDSEIFKKLESAKIHRKVHESSDSEYYIPSIAKKILPTSSVQNTNIKRIICNTSGGETTDSEFVPPKNIQKKEFTDVNMLASKRHKISAYNYEQPVQSILQSSKLISAEDKSYQEHKKVMYQTKTRNKSEQNLFCSKNECMKKLYRNSEPHITFKQKKASGKFSRKARSYFQKNSHCAFVDSDYTSTGPKYQSNKQRYSQTNIQKFSNHRTKKIGYHSNAKLPVQENRTNGQKENNLNSIDQNDQKSEACPQSIKCKCDISPRSNSNDMTESPNRIPPKTQELLNKSYWEYYNKLKHKIKDTGNIEQQYLYQLTVDSPGIRKEKPDEMHGKEFQNQLNLNPEFQTLQQCSALSSMINKALDTKHQSNCMQITESSTNRLIDEQNASKSNNVIPNWTNSSEPLLHEMKHKTGNENDKQYLELKSIIFFGGMMYILVIFLPMLYDYFNHEVYDDYENMSYLECIMDYVLSSFKEAFGGIFNSVKQILFYPPACKKCNNIA